MKKYVRRDYKLLQLLPPNGIKAVFAMPVPDDGPPDGYHELQAFDVAFMALASVTATHGSIDDDGVRCVEDVQKLDPQIVSVSFFRGSWDIDNEAISFAGHLMPGGDVSKCDSHLKPEIKKLLSLPHPPLPAE